MMHFAGRKVEAHALDVVEIGAGNADEARAIRIIDRVDLAILIDAGVAGLEAIPLCLFQLGVFSVAAGALPFDHVGVFRRLAVDRPRVAVVVRRRLARLVVDVREDLEAEILVFVEQFQAGRRVVAASSRDEVLVGEQPFEVGAHALAARRAGIALERGARIGDELIEIVSHGVAPALLAGVWQIRHEGERPAASSVCSPPPCGRGWGWGSEFASAYLAHNFDPPP